MKSFVLHVSKNIQNEFLPVIIVNFSGSLYQEMDK